MNLKTTLALAALSSIAIGTVASAQTAAPAVTAGPPIAGVCTFSPDRALLTSAVGMSVKARLEQIQQQSSAELTAEHNQLLQEQASIEAAAKTTPQDQLEQRVLGLRQRGAQWERKVNVREQEIQATGNKQYERIAAELDPIVKGLFAERHCSILLNSSSVVANLANPSMDVTPAAIQQLNARLTTLTFDREHLEQPMAASSMPVSAAAAGPRPAVTPKKKK
jgi:outer membrane protein